MRYVLMGLALCGGLSGVAQAVAAPASDQATPVADRQAAALQLAKLMMPRELLIEAEMRNFDVYFRQSVLGEMSVAEFEGDYPGLLDAFVAAARPLVQKTLVNGLPHVESQLADLFLAKLTDTEISELSEFYRSPEGHSILRSMSDATDAGAVYRRVSEDPDSQMTTGQVSSQVKSAAVKATKTMSDADRAALLDFMKRPVFVRFAGLQPALRKIMADAHNRKDPEFEAEVNETLAAAAAEHMKKIDAERAAKK